MQSGLTLFPSPIPMAHQLWKQVLSSGDIAIDATMGNGKDTLMLAKYLTSLGGGTVLSFDIQEKALYNTEALLKEHLPSYQTIDHLLLRSHAEFPENIQPESVKLIVYNLGYLPGGNKTLTTMTATTLQSVEKALSLLCHVGVLSLTCYPGHPEGKKEWHALQALLTNLPKNLYCVTHHQWMNRHDSPTLILIQKGLHPFSS